MLGADLTQNRRQHYAIKDISDTNGSYLMVKVISMTISITAVKYIWNSWENIHVSWMLALGNCSFCWCNGSTVVKRENIINILELQDEIFKDE